MSTPFQSIYERFAIKVQDFTLDQLYQTSVSSYESYLKGLLKSAIPNFNKCKVDLADRDDTAQIFNQTLKEVEEEILAVLMQVEWAEKEVNNVLEMRLGLSNSDFRRYAEANNLNAKMELRDKLKEKADAMMIQYSYDNYDFSKI
jgi:hypothetical protein